MIIVRGGLGIKFGSGKIKNLAQILNNETYYYIAV